MNLFRLPIVKSSANRGPALLPWLALALATLSGCVYDPYAYYGSRYYADSGAPVYRRTYGSGSPGDANYYGASRRPPVRTQNPPPDDDTPDNAPAATPPPPPSHPAPPADLAPPPPETKGAGDAPDAGKKDGGGIPTASRTNKPGRVKLPFAPFHELDVSGLPSGSLAKDPSTGQVFRVP